MACPTFAIMGGGQQAIDEPFVGVRTVVREKIVHRGQGGRQAGEIQAESPDERGAVGLGAGMEVFFLQTREDKLIDRVPHPMGITHGG